MFSFRSVGTPEDFFGQLIQSIPAGASCRVMRLNSLVSAAPDFVKTMAKSREVLLSSAIWHLSKNGFNSAITSTGASVRETRYPSLIPSFFGSGVPEYPGMRRPNGIQE